MAEESTASSTIASTQNDEETIESATVPDVINESACSKEKNGNIPHDNVYEAVQQRNRGDLNPFLKPLLLQKASTVNSLDEQTAQNIQTAGDPLSHFCIPTNLKLSDNVTPCVICDYTQQDIEVKNNYDEYLCHLLLQHSLLIADANLIVDLRNYAVYWKKRFQERPLKDFCSKIRTNTGSKDIGKQEEYFLLCDALPEDRQIREDLQMSKLKNLLLRQEFERKDDGFVGICPICAQCYKGNRVILFDHMIKDHNFNIGHPDNIVNVHEFLEAIRKKLEAKQCLCCEQIFKNRIALREHMRKKGHRCLNPKNKEFDQYYMINYLELGKNWQVLQTECERLDDEDDDWSGWNGKGQMCFCFFCKSYFYEADKVYVHMKDDHGFDFNAIRDKQQLSFYEQVKMINYVRREVHAQASKEKTDANTIAARISDQLRESGQWKQPQYYFPACEDDTMLCQLNINDDSHEPEDAYVISEDGVDIRDTVNNSVLTELVVSGYFEKSS